MMGEWFVSIGIGLLAVGTVYEVRRLTRKEKRL